jgi:hypothetical protein
MKHIMDLVESSALEYGECITFPFNGETVELNILEALQALKTFTEANLENRIRTIEEELYSAEVHRMEQNE